jgi:hypothetical protein
MSKEIPVNVFKLSFFSIIVSFIAYGFPLTNYSLSIDSETPINSDFSMVLGRWGTNLIRYHVFEGHLPYFTLLLGLLFLSLTAVELSKLFRFNGSMSYLFCALFVTFPQLSYQLIFTMQADVVPIGFFCAALAISFFLKGTDSTVRLKSLGYFALTSFLLMFVIAIYQALVLLPVVIYLILFFQSTLQDNFNFKTEFRKGMLFASTMVVGVASYYLSVKLLCPPVEGGYLSSYLNGTQDNQFLNACSIWLKNLVGSFYYGARLFIVATIVFVVLLVRFAIQKKWFGLRLLILFLMFIIPFGFSFLITNGYHPPRIYVASGIVFAFIIVYFVSSLSYEKPVIWAISLICIANIYFITNLFYSNYKIYTHDKDTARKMDALIYSKYPNFDPAVNYVYFYGYFPYEHHQKYRLDKSEAFGGSLFSWDNGDNFRIINFFSFTDINDYKMIDNKEVFLKVKDSIEPMPVWPNRESVKMINDVIVVKLGKEKGARLWVE